MPSLYIITGSNGAGKSSVGPEYLPPSIKHKGVFDGDKLYKQKFSEFWKTIKSDKECKRLAFDFVTETFEGLVENALIKNEDFAYEGHFTNEATWDIPRKFKSRNYNINLIFFGLTDTNLSELRVIDRSKEGGHYVDPVTIASNFYGNLEQLNKHFEMFDEVQIFDTSQTQHQVLTIIRNGEPASYIPSSQLPNWCTVNLPAITDKIKLSEAL